MRQALIVAHGQPSDPAPLAAEIAALAASVALHLDGWQVQAATLAEPGALQRALGDMEGGALVYPLFMAGGWFTRVHLPDRLAQAGAQDFRILPPFGMDPAIQDLTVTLAAEAAGDRPPDQVALILAAHGSSRSPAPSEVAVAMAERIRRDCGFSRVAPAYIDQSPRLADLARGWPTDAICLPFFAASGGHVTQDLPQALAEAGFAGRLLPPVGGDARVPALIAAGLKRAAQA